MARNQLGGFFNPGRPLPLEIREEIADIYNAEYSMNEVSRITLVSRRSVTKVVHHYQQYGTAEPFKIGGKHPTKLTDGVLQVVELSKLQKKSECS